MALTAGAKGCTEGVYRYGAFIKENSRMNKIQRKYQKRKRIYFALIAALFGIIMSLGFFTPHDEHQANIFEVIMFTGLAGIVAAIYVVFRCPNCNKTLLPTFSSSLASWGKLHCCPKCGVELEPK